MSLVNRKVLTLDEFTIQQLREIPNATGELSGLLRDMGLAAKRVNVEVNKAGLVDILGDAGTMNVQGEDVKKLDIYANNQFMGVKQTTDVLEKGTWIFAVIIALLCLFSAAFITKGSSGSNLVNELDTKPKTTQSAPAQQQPVTPAPAPKK